ncbi:MAG: hypothetical protein QF371_00060 [Flavobacteriales bacterium]|nr:hypothetical protein [Flavobacteriales bacterium]
MKLTKILTIWISMLMIPTALVAQKKVAVTTFYADKYIDFSELGSAAGLAVAIGQLADDPKFNIEPILDKFHANFFNDYAKEFPFDLIPEKDVVENEQYANYESKFGETKDEDRARLFQRYLTVDGYKPLIETLVKNKNNNVIRMLEIFDSADGVMFVSISFKFVKTSPFTAGIQAYARIKLWNKEGKRVFVVNEFANSKKKVGMVGGIPTASPDKILPMCESAAEKLLADLNKRLNKVAKKAAKKL